MSAERNRIKKEERDKLFEKYPIKGTCNLKAPELNPEVDSFLADHQVRQDKGSEDNQNKIAVALSAIGQSLNLLLENKGGDADRLSVIDNLWDASKILADLHQKGSHLRRSSINPNIEPSVRYVLQKTKPSSLLYGDKLSEKLSEAKSIEKAGQQMKP
ncbi:hypothetical protein QAD02_022225 [Eretmocerus hayati]|uniref:Uncharacterized protein n=1 Tax=Eretmocerus hayati TaxID=131215 RepID=A0ACC2PU10_9HYME|nr:hypothetical protein QAD02_022225 [Eretmocerus hayati]